MNPQFFRKLASLLASHNATIVANSHGGEAWPLITVDSIVYETPLGIFSPESCLLLADQIATQMAELRRLNEQRKESNG